MLSVFLVVSPLWAKDLSHFSGRLLASDFDSGFIKIRIDFSNCVDFSKRVDIKIWRPDVTYSRYSKCIWYYYRKTSKYILARLKDIVKCKKVVNFNSGQAVSLKSDALENNISTALESFSKCFQKRLALSSRVKTLKRLD